MKRDDIHLPGDIVLTGAISRVAGLVINNGKTAKNDKPQVAIIEDEIAVQVLEILMNSTRNIPKTTKLFDGLSYAKYSNQLKATATFIGLQDVKVTPHGTSLGRAVENFNSRVLIDDIGADGI